MATGGDAKGFKQDMLVSIRYRNDLPPPPMPPKLLDIDTGGLAQFLTPAYASALARREEPNIEVDAEGGMPIDMIGIPGYFLGDESAIMTPEIQPVLDPEDHALMLTADQIKSHGAKGNVSFLRKTQYMYGTSQNARANDPLVRPNPRARKSIDNKAAGPLARDDKENIKRHVQKGFDIAYSDSVPYNGAEARGHPSTAAERDAWRNPVHPDNPKLKPVSYHPILPDLESKTDYGAVWTTVKFDKPPLPAVQGRRDNRIDVALLMGIPDEARMPNYLLNKQAFDENPELYDDPGHEPQAWTLNIPKNPDAVPRIKTILNESHPERKNPALSEGLLEEFVDGSERIPYERARLYTNDQVFDVNGRRLMAISVVDQSNAAGASNPRIRKQGPAAYYYPVAQRIRLRADRAKVSKASHSASQEDPYKFPDNHMLLIHDPDDETLSKQQLAMRNTFKGENDSTYKKEFDALMRDVEVEQAKEDAEQDAEKADEVVKQPETLHDGPSDVNMDETEAARQSDAPTNGVHIDYEREEEIADVDADADADERMEES